MAIMMLAIFTAFVCLVFGYFFYWTLHAGFIPPGARAHTIWALGALAAGVGAWIATLLAKRSNTQNRPAAFYGALLAGTVLSIASAAGLLAHPYFAQLDPAASVYAATIWLLAIWSALHLAVGVLMQLYCIARRLAGRLTAKYDMDIVNVALYWHFTIVTIAITIAIAAGIPYLA
jgi:cytochrome c oxidase subunit I+III